MTRGIKLNALFFFWLIILFGITCTQRNNELNIGGDTSQIQALWKILGSVYYPDNELEDELIEKDDYYFDENWPEELENNSLEYNEVNERHLIYPLQVHHKICKVVTKIETMKPIGYEYSFDHYQDISCEETVDKPFSITPPHMNEYCIIVHHPHERIDCATKHINVAVFRRKNRRYHWQNITRKVGVGCGCSVGFKYL